MAKKKPAKRSVVKAPAKKKTVKKPVARAKAPQKKPVKKKPPILKAAARATKPVTKPVKSTSKKASSRQSSRLVSAKTELVKVPAPEPTQQETEYVAEMQEPQTVPCQPGQAQPISEDEIRHRAYLKWEAAGRPPGDGSHFWNEAERELLQRS